MQRLWRWTVIRRSLLAAALAVTWAAWTILPTSPAISWSAAARQPDHFELTPDGETVVHTAELSLNEIFSFSRARAGPVRMCDASTGRLRYELFNDEDMYARIDGFSPYGSWLVVDQEAKHTARVLEAAEGRELARFPGDEHWGWSISRSPDGRELALAPPHGSEIQLWDIATQRVRIVLPEAWQVVAYSPDGRRLATAWWDKPEEWAAPDRRVSIRVWDVAAGCELARRDLPAVASADFRFSPDGRWLAALSESLQPIKHRYSSMWAQPFAPETSVPGNLTLWDMTTGNFTTLAEFPDSSRQGSIAFSPDGRWLFLRTRTGPQFWDLQSSPPARRTAPHTGIGDSYYPVFISHTDRMVLSGNDPAVLELWSTGDMVRRSVCRLRAPEGTPQITTSPDGSTLAVLLDDTSSIYSRMAEFFNKYFGLPKTMSRRCVIQLFDTQTGAERAVFDQGGEGRLLGFSPRGTTLWTSAFVADSADEKNGVAIVRGWTAPNWRPPFWLLAMTAAGLVLIILDCRCGRRRTAGGTSA